MSIVIRQCHKQSAAAATALAAVSFVDFALRKNGYVSTYAITWGTAAVSYAVPIAKHHQFPRPLIFCIGSGIAVGTIVNQGYVKESVAPSVTGLTYYKVKGPRAAVAAAAFSAIDELLIQYNITDRHYLSALALCNIIKTVFPQSKYLSFGAIASSPILAWYEQDILEFIFPINSTKHTYNLLLESYNDDVEAKRRCKSLERAISMGSK